MHRSSLNVGSEAVCHDLRIEVRQALRWPSWATSAPRAHESGVIMAAADAMSPNLSRIARASARRSWVSAKNVPRFGVSSQPQ